MEDSLKVKQPKAHNILNVVAVTDRLVILHRGRKAVEVATKDTTEHEIVSLIIGKAVR